MTWFELIKQVVRVPEAAAYYGLQVSRNGMVVAFLKRGERLAVAHVGPVFADADRELLALQLAEVGMQDRSLNKMWFVSLIKIL